MKSTFLGDGYAHDWLHHALNVQSGISKTPEITPHDPYIVGNMFESGIFKKIIVIAWTSLKTAIPLIYLNIPDLKNLGYI